MFAMGPEFISDRHQFKASPFTRTEDRRGLRRLFEFLQPFEKLVLVGHGPALQGDIRRNLTEAAVAESMCLTLQPTDVRPHLRCEPASPDAPNKTRSPRKGSPKVPGLSGSGNW